MAIDWQEHLRTQDRRRFHLVRGVEARGLKDAAADMGYIVVHIDLSSATSKSQLLELVASAMAFPETSGRNWDALLDLMSDLSWWQAKGYVLVIQGGLHFRDASPGNFSTFLEILVDVGERMTMRSTGFDVVLAGPLRKFDIETAVGVTNICDHARS